MKIVIKATNFKLTPSLEQYVKEKIDSLEKFVKILYNTKYFNHLPKRSAGLRRTDVLRTFGKGRLSVEAWVEIGRITRKQLKGPIFFAECQMKFPGKTLRAEAKNKDLKLAINEVKDELQRELKEYKEKISSEIKRKSRIAKKELKISPQARFYRKGRIREEI